MKVGRRNIPFDHRRPTQKKLLSTPTRKWIAIPSIQKHIDLFQKLLSVLQMRKMFSMLHVNTFNRRIMIRISLQYFFSIRLIISFYDIDTVIRLTDTTDDIDIRIFSYPACV